MLMALVLALTPMASGMQTQDASRTATLPTGKRITPVGEHIEVGSYPNNLVLSSDGKRLICADTGFREFLTAIDLDSWTTSSQIPYNGKNQGMYFGLAVQPTSGRLFVSRGAEDLIDRIALREGKLEKDGEPISTAKEKKNDLPNHPAGIDFTGDGKLLVVAHNQTGLETDFKGSVGVYDAETGAKQAEIRCSGFPYALAVRRGGVKATRKAYVASERDACVDVVDIDRRQLVKSIAVGAQPEGLLFNKSGSKLFVANAGSDSISIIDPDKDAVKNTILVRPTELRGLPGAGPQGMALSPDESKLYVALSDMNAIGVVDLWQGRLTGYIPTGWLPTAVVAKGDFLYVACAKGVQVQNPNGADVKGRGTYIQNIIEGTVSRIRVPSRPELIAETRRVVENNRLRPNIDQVEHPDLKNPGIQHVIYVIKENRTYDNVLGDVAKGNGDPKLCLFPKEVSPNQHALAERFVLLDNFHVCAEVSQDGWMWSTCGMVSSYASRNTPYNYSGRGRSYDTEGSNNGVPIDLIGIPDVAKPASGYIWDHCAAGGVSFRNYGFFLQYDTPEDKRFDKVRLLGNNFPAKKALLGKTDTDFPSFDMTFPDSGLYDHYGFKFPQQKATYGKKGSTNRFQEWKREFDGFVKSGKMPKFQMVRFPCDHTVGTQKNMPTPQSMVADNDYAVGQLVEAVSHSKFWKSTVICVLEDDAQAGLDHVDAHRSTAYLVSPYIKPGTVDHRFYNTDSMLRTMEILLGLKPMSQYDAVASPISVFEPSASNSAPFKAILPSREIACKINGVNAYRSKESAKISRTHEESLADETLNDILWGAIKGPQTPLPPVARTTRLGVRKDADDD